MELSRSRARHAGADVAGPGIAATIYALVNESVYLRLVDGLAWTPDHYRDWLARTLVGTLLAPAALNPPA